MATIANPVGAFDFAHSTHLPGSSYSFDPLDQFGQDPASSAAASGMDRNFMQYYMTRQGNPTSQQSSTTSRPSDFPQQGTPASSYPYGQITPTASTSSDNHSHAFTSGMNSPELQFPPFGSSLSDFPSGTGYMSSAEQPNFGFDQSDMNYEAFLAGEKQPVFVGEWQSFPQSSSDASQHAVPMSFPSHQPPQSLTLFKKPEAPTSTSSMKTLPSDASPSFQKALRQSSSAVATAPRRASSHLQQPVMQGPRSVPPSPQATISQGQDWMQPTAMLQSHNFLLPESQFFNSPTSVQEPHFPLSSPQAQQSLFFHQSSGNFVAPLESSCWSSRPNLFASLVLISHVRLCSCDIC